MTAVNAMVVNPIRLITTQGFAPIALFVFKSACPVGSSGLLTGEKCIISTSVNSVVVPGPLVSGDTVSGSKILFSTWSALSSQKRRDFGATPAGLLSCASSWVRTAC